MASKMELDIEELMQKIKLINEDVRYKGGRFALRKAAQVVATDAVRMSKAVDDPDTPEDISKNVAIRWNGRLFKASNGYQMGFRVGILGGAQTPSARPKKKRGKYTLSELGELSGKGKDNPGGDTFYWRFVNFGTKNIQSKHFFEPALKNNTSRATAEFVTQFEKALDRAIRKKFRQR
ncbi:HK97-gp10 family putative phage morphogenesis protein [Nitrosomonas eutropha]|uniref:HK97 gp10 family phage protein n=2 Tax=Nitrosomonas eutropha TaxID=916 RepID=A0ABX5M9B4_9PROT|nr:HK97-gp10 family putative phage morphogenesis protein [Nitrosomonas eutropha]ABI59711.1 phage protein, HK97 gp10 family protein [Nitrosomonas eutropha C91]PXV82490.1 HK97 gp10 family phage protein [Nitrosomonas eutropha]